MNALKKLWPGRGRGTAHQILSFGAAEGLSRGINWGLLVVLPLFLQSTEEYGRVGLLVSIEVLVSSVSMVGLDRAILRFYANEESPSPFLRSVLVLWAIVAWIPSLIVLILYLAGWETFFGIPVAPHLFLMSVIIALFNLNMLCVCVSRSENDLGNFLKFRLWYVGLKFVFVLLLAVYIGNSLAYVAGFGIAAVGMMLFNIPLLRRTASTPSESAVVRKLLLFGWPFVFHVASGNVLTYFSRFFLEAYSTTEDVGVFTFAFTIGGGIYLVYASLATYFEPRIYSHSDDKQKCEFWLALYTNLCVSIAAAGGALLLLVFPFITGYLPEDYHRALPILSMVMGTILLRPIYIQSNFRLVANERTHYIANASFVGAIVSIAFNFWLIPLYGIWGAAVALFISNFFFCGYTLFISLRVAKLSWREDRSLPTYLICVGGAFSTIMWAHHFGFAVLTLLLVCLATSGILIRSVRAERERQP